ncbi:MAG TPA: thiamine phosphate synthase [Nitrospirales bacterium]|nr:thiamine phosphate synthase [Nitrospirales bacterium]
MEAEKGGADYIGFGPMYYTRTKDTSRAPLDPNEAQEQRERIKIPIFGIGEIKVAECWKF